MTFDLTAWLQIAIGISAGWGIVLALLLRVRRSERAESDFWSTYDD